MGLVSMGTAVRALTTPTMPTFFARRDYLIGSQFIQVADVNGDGIPDLLAYYNHNSYGGGKLGIYSFWDTVDAAGAPISGINNNTTAPNQYEFYNYSPSLGNANPQEVGNQYEGNNSLGFLGVGGSPGNSLALAYYNDFFNLGNNSGSNIQAELYQLINNGSSTGSVPQVQAAIQTAFNNYILYLECTGSMTGNNGQPEGIDSGVICPPNYSS